MTTIGVDMQFKLYWLVLTVRTSTTIKYIPLISIFKLLKVAVPFDSSNVAFDEAKVSVPFDLHFDKGNSAKEAVHVRS